MSTNHALVLGASGLVGWGIVDQLLRNYPTQGSYAKVTALTNRVLTGERSKWPGDIDGQPHLDLVSGIDLLNEEHTLLVEQFKTKVADVASVSHVFYCAYKQNYDSREEFLINKKMLENVLHVLDLLCPKVTSVVVPTGTKSYGIIDAETNFAVPFKELLPRPREETVLSTFYFALEDVVSEWSNKRRVSWCIARPDAIIGFSPNGAAFNLAGHWAAYLSLYRLVEGEGAKVTFPGTEAGYEALYNDSSPEIVGKFCIWAALNPEKTHGEIFNVSDSSQPSRLRDHWPILTEYFGLVGQGPQEGSTPLSPQAYIDKNARAFLDRGIAAPQIFAVDAVDAWAQLLEKDRQLSLEKVRNAGFTDAKDPTSSWLQAFDLYRASRMIA